MPASQPLNATLHLLLMINLLCPHLPHDNVPVEQLTIDPRSCRKPATRRDLDPDLMCSQWLTIQYRYNCMQCAFIEVQFAVLQLRSDLKMHSLSQGVCFSLVCVAVVHALVLCPSSDMAENHLFESCKRSESNKLCEAGSSTVMSKRWLTCSGCLWKAVPCSPFLLSTDANSKFGKGT